MDTPSKYPAGLRQKAEEIWIGECVEGREKTADDTVRAYLDRWAPGGTWDEQFEAPVPAEEVAVTNASGRDLQMRVAALEPTEDEEPS